MSSCPSSDRFMSSRDWPGGDSTLTKVKRKRKADPPAADSEEEMNVVAFRKGARVCLLWLTNSGELNGK